jgi:hypothetical protein
MAGWTGLEPATSGLTGQRSNQLNYHPLRNTKRESRIKYQKMHTKVSFLTLCALVNDI